MTDDPLDGADVGETRTVRESVDLYTVDFEPDVFYGSDRFSDTEIADVEVAENEHGDRKLVVTFEGEVTKALPRRWDRAREPLTEREERTARRREWVMKALATGGLLAPAVVATVVATWAMDAGDMTVNGEPMQAPGIEFFGAFFVFVFVVLWILPRLPRWFGGRSA